VAEAKGRRGLVVLNTGNGKGKTTAALGILMRAWGRGMKVVMLQFIKASHHRFGEHKAAEKMGVEVIPMGRGFTWLSKDLDRDKAMARACWEEAVRRLRSGEYDIVVLDEITYPIRYGWLDVGEVIDALASRPPHVHVVLTGRNAPQELVDFADLVTEMREVKHPFKQGIRAQPGLEY
jgi:cob(I)alamin adenosyltransferase